MHMLCRAVQCRPPARLKNQPCELLSSRPGGTHGMTWHGGAAIVPRQFGSQHTPSMHNSRQQQQHRSRVKGLVQNTGCDFTDRAAFRA